MFSGASSKIRRDPTFRAPNACWLDCCWIFNRTEPAQLLREGYNGAKV